MDPEIEARLMAAARQQGINIETFVEKLIAEQLTPDETTDASTTMRRTATPGETNNEADKAEDGSANLSTDSDDTDGGEAKGQRP